MDYTDSITHSMSTYTDVCQLAVRDDEVFSKFKSMPAYTAILEHVSFDQGKEYIQEILKYNPHLLSEVWISKFLENDKYGSPTTYYYDSIKTKISPTTLRYIKILSDLLQMFGYDMISKLQIIEIGVGYGGLCKVIQDGIHLMSKTNPVTMEYYTIDLVPVSGLVDKYLRHFPDCYKRTHIITTEDMKAGWKLPKGNFLVMSHYAFSECSSSVRENYINEIINKCSYGYLTINVLSPEENEDLMVKLSIVADRKIEKLHEVPLTDSKNYIIVFKD